MRRGTTPTLTLRVTNADGSACDLSGCDVYATLRERGCRGGKITKSGDELEVSRDGDATLVSLTLSQEETLSLRAGYKVDVQVRCVDAGGRAQASTVAEVDVGAVLMEGVI